MTSPALSYFLNSSAAIALLETIEISHPYFTQTYRKVRNHTDGIEARLETGELVEFGYYPMRIEANGAVNDLDAGFTITFGDLGEIISKELEAITDFMQDKPAIIYRAYRMDDLGAPMIGPLRFEANSFSFTREGATFEAVAPDLNRTRTGETYNLFRFFSLRGFLK